MEAFWYIGQEECDGEQLGELISSVEALIADAKRRAPDIPGGVDHDDLKQRKEK